ncbi:MAG: hypothetical protein A3K65_06890 [Euryarchaeota archaeon RBG_16_68_12]|nr:MAG: hypothetical protein A3K65_06890 [Euryarchaeota archaeon RBG_16_68_12]
MHAAGRAFSEPGKPHKLLELPPELDMGILKLDDLYFDIDVEVARMRAADRARVLVTEAIRRPHK